MKKALLILVMLLGTILLVSGCSAKDTASKSNDSAKSDSAKTDTATELRVAIQPAASYAPLYIAKEKGWLEEALKDSGVAVQWTSFDAGPPENESFAAGQQDIGVMGDVPAIIAHSAGQDTRIIGIASYGPKAFGIIIPKDSKVTSVKDLKGKKVGLVKGSYAHHLLYLLLQKNGLTIDDIKVINMQAADMQNALATKNVDAAVIWEPNITRSEEAGVAKLLADGTGLKRGELVIMARNEFVSQNPKITQIFLQVYKRGCDFIKDNPKEAAQLTAADFKLEPAQLEKVLPKYFYTTKIEDTDVKELKKSADFLKQIDIIKNPVDVDKFVDRQYVESAGIN